MEPTHQEQIEGIKGGYCLDIQVIHLDIQVNTVITLPRGNYDGSPISPNSPRWITFLLFILQKILILLNIKDVEFDFRMGYILVVFPFFE